jgi:hypothetical protein
VVTLGVRVRDFSAIRGGTVTVSNGSHQETTSFSGPGTRFDRDILLASGNNSVRIAVSDVLGNTRTQQFRLQVLDRGPPSISLDLFPETTTARSIDFSGTVSDAIWVKNASIHVEHLDRTNSTGITAYNETIRRDSPYEIARAGRTIPFTERLLLEPGLNRITVTASDYRGNVTNRTVEIERVGPTTPATNDPPSVAIHENRTVFRDDGSVRLNATVADPDWNLESVSVETENYSTGEIIDFERFGDLDGRGSVSIDTTLSTDGGPVWVRVRAGDAFDDRRRDSVLRYAPGESAPDGTPATPDPTTAVPTAATPDGGPSGTDAPTTNATAAGPADGGGLPLIGSLSIAGILGFVVSVAPFALGAIVFVAIAYVVLRRVRGRGGESAS